MITKIDLLQKACINTGEQLYQPMAVGQTNEFLTKAGTEPKRLLRNLIPLDGFLKAKELSVNSNVADFPMQLAMKYGLETRIGYDANGGYTEVIGLLIRFEGTSNLYNPSDAGQFLWGAWMRKNTFQLSNTIIGSNLNEISRGGDSEADQRAIINGYNYY